MAPRLAQRLHESFQDFVRELVSLVRIPSISATGEGVRACASFLAERMRSYGIEVSLREVRGGNSLIVGSLRGRSKDRCLLVYGHYDVQPPDPLDKWVVDPFSGRISDGRILGRGAADSKGNLMAFLSGARMLSQNDALPISLKFLFEGEEEIGSPHLPKFIDSHAAELRADAVVCYDGELDPSGRPMITLGLKGLIYLELRCKKMKEDVHSSKASLLPSAPWRLIKALNELTDAEGRIAIPGWRRGIVDPGPAEVELLKRIPFDEEAIKEEFGVSHLLRGKHGLEALRDFLYEPTCNIAGLTSGYQGEGSKTVLPAEASAKIDMRLVYDQQADGCLRLLKRHLATRGFGDVEVAVLSKQDPSHTPVDAPIAKAVAEAARSAYGQEPVIYPNHHASGPDYLFTKNLGLHSVWTGCAPASGHAHAPNEFIGLDDYKLGILYACEQIRCFATTLGVET